METDVLGGRLNILTNSIKSLGTAKEAEEKSRIFVQKFKDEIADFTIQRDNFEVRISELLKENEQLHIYLKEMNAARLKANSEKEQFLKLSKEKVNYIERELKFYRSENITFKDQISELKKNLKLSLEEKEILRERISKMKIKRNVRINGLIWRNWNKDYTEEENFKWSCVKHIREWSGQMWWCWGSTNKYHPGCKFNYHESKNFMDSFDNTNRESENQLMKKTRCTSCREMGHICSDWPRDPNFRTNHSIFDEFFRVDGLKDLAVKNFANDANIKTRMLFEKLVTVRDFSPFKRGILMFDDYNYKSINNNILPTIEELLEAEGDESDFSSNWNSKEDEIERDLDQEYLLLKADKKRIKKLEKESMINKLGESNDYPFTVREVNEIHYMQKDDPFQDVLGIRNDAKLDFLNLADKIDIKSHIEGLADHK